MIKIIFALKVIVVVIAMMILFYYLSFIDISSKDFNK
jgi:hypothetical protein